MLTKKIWKFLLLVSINFCFIPNSFAIDPYLFVQETADEASEALNKRLSIQDGIKVEFQEIDGANHFFSNKEQELSFVLDKYIKKESSLY